MKKGDNWKSLAVVGGAIIAVWLSIFPNLNYFSFPDNLNAAIASIAANCASVAILALLYWLATRSTAESERQELVRALEKIKQDIESLNENVDRLQHSIDHVLDQRLASKWLIDQIEKKNSQHLSYVGGTGLFMARRALPRARAINHPIGISLLLRPGNDPFEKLCASILCFLLHHESAKGNSVELLSIEPGIAEFRIDLTVEGALITPDGHAEEAGLNAWLVPSESPLYRKLKGMIASRQDAVGLRKSLSATTITEIIGRKRAAAPILEPDVLTANSLAGISEFHVATSLSLVFDVMSELGIKVPSRNLTPLYSAKLAHDVVKYLRDNSMSNQLVKQDILSGLNIVRWIDAELFLRHCAASPKKALRDIINRIELEKIQCQSHYNGFYKFYIDNGESSDFLIRLHVWIDFPPSAKREVGSFFGDIHTHSWSFGSCVLLGSLRNIIWRENSAKKGVVYRKLTRHWDEAAKNFFHVLSEGRRNFYLLQSGRSDDLLSGDIYWQRSDELHSVVMGSGQIAATLVVHSRPRDKSASSVMYRHASIVDKSILSNGAVPEQSEFVDGDLRGIIIDRLRKECAN